MEEEEEEEEGGVEEEGVEEEGVWVMARSVERVATLRELEAGCLKMNRGETLEGVVEEEAEAEADVEGVAVEGVAVEGVAVEGVTVSGVTAKLALVVFLPALPPPLPPPPLPPPPPCMPLLSRGRSSGENGSTPAEFVMSLKRFLDSFMGLTS